jgi:hypothetical protein
VPKATTNAPISIGFMPIEAATSKAEDTVNLAEIRTIKVPKRILTKVTVLLMPSFFPEFDLAWNFYDFQFFVLPHGSSSIQTFINPQRASVKYDLIV